MSWHHGLQKHEVLRNLISYFESCHLISENIINSCNDFERNNLYQTFYSAVYLLVNMTIHLTISPQFCSKTFIKKSSLKEFYQSTIWHYQASIWNGTQYWTHFSCFTVVFFSFIIMTVCEWHGTSNHLQINCLFKSLFKQRKQESVLLLWGQSTWDWSIPLKKSLVICKVFPYCQFFMMSYTFRHAEVW